jgi:hypothetical protein
LSAGVSAAKPVPAISKPIVIGSQRTSCIRASPHIVPLD